nr:response regulator [Desulfobulbaceae bacterium]
MNYSLCRILGFIVVITVISVLVLDSFVFYHLQKGKIVEHMKFHADLSLETLTNNVQNLVESYSINEYEKLVLSEMAHEEFLAIIVRDFHMGMILGQEAYLTGKIRNEDGSVIDYDPENQTLTALLESCFLSVTSPLTSASGKPLGEITICCSDEIIKPELVRIIRESLLNMVILSTLLIVLLFFAIQYFVLKPISEIIISLSRTDKNGIPSGEFVAHGAVEVRNLCMSLQKMIHAVKKYQQDLKRNEEELELRVEDRTTELICMNDNMQLEIAERMHAERELTEAKKKAEAASEAKSMFLANMSHEIRTPMNAVLGMIRLALESSRNPEQRRYLETAFQSAELLLSIINEILDFSKIEANQMELDEVHFELENLLQSVVKTFDMKAREKGLDLRYHFPPGINTQLLGDEYRLRQILLNLVGNALKFTETGEISIHVQSASDGAKDEGIILQFSVQDTGIGISAEALPDIFTQFSQADNSITRKFGGTGLGLAICQKLTKLFGGDIWVESEPGRGAAFYFTARFLQGDADLIQKKDEALSIKIVLPHMHILLVEDNQFNRDLAQAILERHNHTVALAENGLEALKMLSSSTYDVILMDVQMPELDGISATKLIRACERPAPVVSEDYRELLIQVQNNLKGKTIPIIAMTARAMADDRRICIESGMDGYITKPFAPLEVFRTIAQVTGGKVITQEVNDASVDGEIKEGNIVNKPGPVEKVENIRAHLMSTYKISPEKVNTLINAGIQSLLEYLSQAENALKNEDFESLKRSAHTMKGSLRNMGLDALANLAERIENFQTRKGEESLQGLTQQLQFLHEELECMR